jgi:hypothetical protein
MYSRINYSTPGILFRSTNIDSESLKIVTYFLKKIKKQRSKDPNF